MKRASVAVVLLAATAASQQTTISLTNLIAGCATPCTSLYAPAASPRAARARDHARRATSRAAQRFTPLFPCGRYATYSTIVTGTIPTELDALTRLTTLYAAPCHAQGGPAPAAPPSAAVRVRSAGCCMVVRAAAQQLTRAPFRSCAARACGRQLLRNRLAGSIPSALGALTALIKLYGLVSGACG